MSEHTSSRGHDNRWFALLYCTRLKVHKGDVTILNLSLLFSALAALSAPWVAVAGLIVALALGYRFHIARNDPAFASSFDDVMQGAAQNVKSAVDSVVQDERGEE